LEIGSITKKLSDYDKAQDMFTEAGKFIATYSDDEIYGEFKGEAHPLMQQYFL